MTPSVPVDLVTDGLLALLRSSGRVIFDAEYARDPDMVATNPAYAADPLRPVYPLGILHTLPGGSSDATPDLAFTRQDVVLAYQLTVVSDLRSQAQRVTARLRDLFLTGELPLPDGWGAFWRGLDDAMPGIDRVGNHPNTVYNSHLGLRLGIGPA